MADLGGGAIDPETTKWLAIATAFGGGGILKGLFDYFVSGRASVEKTRAETLRLISDMYDAKTRTLIEGYENRITDLLAEVHALRVEVVALRQALDHRPRRDELSTGLGM